MPWVKLDDQFFAHPKVIDLTAAAKLLYLNALTYAAAQLTDGVISPGALRSVAAMVDVPVTCAEELVRAGLWSVTGCGHAIHDYAEYNPSAAQVKRDREATRRRQQDWREKHRESDGTYTVTNSADNGVSNTVTNDRPVPRPVPVPSYSRPTPTPVPPAVEDVPPTAAPEAPTPEVDPVAIIEAPTPTIRAVPKPPTLQASPDGFTLLTAWGAAANKTIPGKDERRRMALLADDLLRQTGGDLEEATAYVQWDVGNRIAAGKPPNLQYAIDDYVKTWRQRGATNGRSTAHRNGYQPVHGGVDPPSTPAQQRERAERAAYANGNRALAGLPPLSNV